MKRLWWITPLVCLALLFAFLPGILSSSFGTSFLNWYLSNSERKVEIRAPSFSWSSPQEIKSLDLVTSGSTTQFLEITSSSSFFQFLSQNFAKTTIKQLLIVLDGTPKEGPSSSGAIQGDFQIDSFRIIEKRTNVQFAAQKVSFVTNKSKTELYMNGESSSKSGKGNVAIAANIGSPIFSKSTPFSLQCSINRLPTEVLTALTSLALPEYTEIPNSLFGEYISLDLRGDKQGDEILISCKPYSSNLNGDINVRMTEGLFALSRPASLSGVLHPSLLNPLIKQWDLSLESPIHFGSSIERLVVPIQNHRFNWKKSALTTSLQTSSGKISFSEHPHPYYLQECDVSIKSDSLESAVTLSGKIEGDYDKKVLSTLFGDATIQYPFSAQKIEKLQLHTQQLPLQLLSTLSGYPLETYLGQYGSGSVTYTGKELSGELSTSACKTSPFSFISQGILKLRSPFTVNYQTPDSLIPPQFSPIQVNGTVNALTINPNNLEEIAGDGSFSFAPFQGEYETHKYKVRGATIDVHAASFTSIVFKGSTQLQYNTQGFLQALIPSTLPITFSGELNAANRDITNLVLNVENTHLSGNIEGDFINNTFRFTKDATFTVDPAIQLINGNISRLSTDAPIIRETTPWKVAISSLKVDKNTFSAQGFMQTREITFETQQLLFPTSVMNLDTTFSLGSSNTYTLRGKTGKGTIECKVGTGKSTSISVTGDSLPVNVIDTLLDPQDSYVSLLGDVADISAELEGEEYCDTAKVKLKAPLLSGSFSLKRTGDMYELRGGSVIDWSLTPAGYASIVAQSSRMRLTTPSSIHIAFDTYTFPFSKNRFFPTQSTFLSPSAITASVEIPSMHFVDSRTKEQVGLSKLSSSLNRKSKTAPLSFNLHSNVEGSSKDNKKGKVAFTGTLDDYTLPNGRVSLEHADMQVKGDISTMPSSLFDALLATSGSAALPPSALFGPTVSMTMRAAVKDGRGPLTMDVHSPYFRAQIDSSIEKGTAYLQKPMTAIIVMTPKLSHALLGSVSVDALSIEKPITLTISPRGFAIPLSPFSIAQSRIGYGQLDLGQIIVRDSGNPTLVGDIFEIKKRPSTIHLWFAPLDFSIVDGSMYIGRTEILFDRTYEIAVWGNVDLVREYVNMTLGLTSQSLRKALGLPLPPDYVMQVPFKGPINGAKIDKAAALAKIAFIVAREQGKKSDNVYGNIFGILGDLADDQSTVPPAKHPFPWEK